MEQGVSYVIEACKKAECDMVFTTRTLLIYHLFMRNVDDIVYDPAMVAAAAMRLSAKTEEKEFDLDELLFLFYHMVHKNVDNLDRESKKFEVLKKSLVTVENIMARMVSFTFGFNVAHQYLVPFLNVLLHRAQHINGFLEKMTDTTIKLISDFYTNRMCLNYKPEDITITCLDTALHFHGFVQHLHMLYPWHQGFSAGLSVIKVKEMRRVLLGIYKDNFSVQPSANLEQILSPELLHP